MAYSGQANLPNDCVPTAQLGEQAPLVMDYTPNMQLGDGGSRVMDYTPNMQLGDGGSRVMDYASNRGPGDAAYLEVDYDPADTGSPPPRRLVTGRAYTAPQPLALYQVGSPVLADLTQGQATSLILVLEGSLLLSAVTLRLVSVAGLVTPPEVSLVASAGGLLIAGPVTLNGMEAEQQEWVLRPAGSSGLIRHHLLLVVDTPAVADAFTVEARALGSRAP